MPDPLVLEYEPKGVLNNLRAMGKRIADGFSDVSLARSIFNYLGKVTIGHFREQRAADGSPWAKLSPVTEGVRDERHGRRRKKPKRGRDHKALQDDGTLMRSLLPREVGGDAIRETSPTDLRYGTNVPYGIYHQEGREWPVTAKQHGWMLANLGVFKPVGSILKIPQRQFIGTSNADEKRLAQIVEYWAVDGDAPTWN